MPASSISRTIKLFQGSQLKVAFCEKVEVCIDWKWVVVILNGASAALYGKLAVQLKEIWW